MQANKKYHKAFINNKIYKIFSWIKFIIVNIYKKKKLKNNKKRKKIL